MSCFLCSVEQKRWQFQENGRRARRQTGFGYDTRLKNEFFVEKDTRKRNKSLQKKVWWCFFVWCQCVCVCVHVYRLSFAMSHLFVFNTNVFESQIMSVKHQPRPTSSCWWTAPGASAVWTSKPSELLSVAWWASLTSGQTGFRSASLPCFTLQHVLVVLTFHDCIWTPDVSFMMLVSFRLLTSLKHDMCLSQVWLSTAGIPKPSGISTLIPPRNPFWMPWPTYPTKEETQWRVNPSIYIDNDLKGIASEQALPL